MRDANPPYRYSRSYTRPVDETARGQESTKYTNNSRWDQPINAAYITAAQPVAHGAVPNRTERYFTAKTRLLSRVKWWC